MAHILLADDHNIVRAGIRRLIGEHFRGVQIDEAGDGNDTLNRLRSNGYDLVLLDISMPDADFGQLMDWMKVTSPGTRVLVFTMHREDIYGVRCLNLGARGFLQKTASEEEIIRAIKRVLDDKKYISPNLAELLAESRNNPEQSNPFDHLSEREMGIAILLNKGKSLPEICDILHIQYSTANTHKRRLFEKLNVHSILSLSKLMQAYKIVDS